MLDVSPCQRESFSTVASCGLLLPAQSIWPETLGERKALSNFLEHTGSGSAKSKHTFVCMFYKIRLILLHKKSMLCLQKAVPLVGTKLYQYEGNVGSPQPNAAVHSHQIQNPFAISLFWFVSLNSKGLHSGSLCFVKKDCLFSRNTFIQLSSKVYHSDSILQID